MRTKKIRGHRRHWKNIDNWIEAHKSLDLHFLKDRQYDYAKIRVHPWSGINMVMSQIPEPKGTTKSKILYGLIEIYDTWKTELHKLGEPYYLKIWLFEPRFSLSQVVCAIGGRLDFYENTFFKPVAQKELVPKKYGQLENRMSEFNWEYRVDEDSYEDNYLGAPQDYTNIAAYEETKIFLNRIMKKPHRIVKLKEPVGGATESYLFKKGDVWIGEK